jgi:hypothetical protein
MRAKRINPENPKPAADQYASMCDALDQGRQTLLDAGVPGADIAYVLRNNCDDDGKYDGLGSATNSIEFAKALCSGVLSCSHLYGTDLFDCRAVDRRNSHSVWDLLYGQTHAELTDIIARIGGSYQ